MSLVLIYERSGGGGGGTQYPYIYNVLLQDISQL